MPMFNTTLSKNPLIILDEKDSWEGHDAQIICWDGPVEEGGLSIPKMIDENGDELKRLYISKVHELSECRVNGESVKKHLTVFDDFSFWWMTLLSEKSIFKSGDIHAVFKLLLLDNMLDSYYGDEIIVLSSDIYLKQYFKFKVERENLRVEFKRQKLSISTLKFTLPNVVVASAYFLRFIYQSRAAILKKTQLESDYKPNFSVITYSGNIDYSEFKKGKVRSGYWSGLDDLLCEGDQFVIWLMLFIPSKELPSLNVAMAERDKYFNLSGNNRIVFLEELCSFRVLVRILRRYISLVKKSFCIGRILRDNCFFSVMENDWLSSIRGKVAMGGCIQYTLLEEAFTKSGIAKNKVRGLYTYENQAWERALCHLWKGHSNQELIGFQHVSGKFFDLRPFDGFKDNNFSYDDAPIPDTLIVNGVSAKAEMECYQYPSERVFVAESLRNLYLTQNKGGERKDDCKEATLLVITDYEIQVTESQLKLLSESWDDIKEHFSKVIVKPHPFCSIKDIMRKYKLESREQIEISNSALSLLWHESTVAFASNATAASLEACYMGLPTIVCENNNFFNVSPLRGVEGVHFVSTPKEMRYALSNLTTSNLPKEHLCLDSDLKCWRRILELN
ncbi:TIGR04326 family surface carbohydrate biosynthesis protein [Vibrio nomapromontoriensis]|uniref:TIGR04326 family surface carbohydrate biosynthesis protein n=1 Tax=Vibrio nomapromontoriensis TaxID=2910246 RepID=UPI003D0BA47F